MHFTPKTEKYKEKVAASFNRQKFMSFIGASLEGVEPGFCEIQLSKQEHLTQQHGFFHAGIVSTLADNAAGYAAFSLMEESSSVLTVELKLNLLSPANGDSLIARATVLKSGKTITVCRSDIYTVVNGVEKLCAAAQSTLIELKDTPDSSPS